MRRVALLLALMIGGCGEDDSACQTLLDLCLGCGMQADIEVCEARAKDRDQVQCSLALDDIRANCTDAGMPDIPDMIAPNSSRDASVSTIEGGS